MEKINSKIKELKAKFDIVEEVRKSCTDEEQAEFEKREQAGESIPEDIYKDQWGDFHHIIKKNMDKEAIDLYIRLQQLSYTRTIKNCLVYFTVLSVISLILVLINII